MSPRPFALLALAATALPAIAQTTPSRTAIVGVTVVDVERGAHVADQTVLLDDDKITAVGTRAATAVPAGARTIDGQGRFLLPGLVDAHVHLVVPAAFGPAFVANGVTLARDMGQTTSSAVHMREQFATGQITGPEVVVTGAIVDGPKPVWPFSEACPDADAAREAVRKLKGEGVDFIKVYSLLPADAWRAALDEAGKVGLRAIGHVPNTVSLMDTVAAGQLSVEHLTGCERLVAELAGQ